MTTDIARVEPAELSLATQNPITAMMQAITSQGVTTEHAAALEKLTDLYMKVEAANAKKDFALAMSQLQAELPRVAATKGIPSKDGTIRSTFAPYEQIMAQIAPSLNKHGFSVGFTISVSQDSKRLAAVCTLTHSGGHSQSNEFSVRIGSGPPGCSDAQADGAARSYARRGALCDALNIVVDHDMDARQQGDTITEQEAKMLRTTLASTGGDEAAFLRFAGAASFEEIRTARLPQLVEALACKARSQNRPMTDAEKKEVLAREAAEAAKGGR